MKVCVVVGTRPEIIKMSPIVRALDDFFIIHTGQHYEHEMDKVFFEQLKLPEPQFRLDVGGCSPGNQLAKVIDGVEQVLMYNIPDVLLSLGDTNSVIGSIIAGSKCKVKTGHVEAGLRSEDRSMSEEINRILADHCADFLFAPTFNACSNLFNEGIPLKRVEITGNTIVDAINQNLEIAMEQEHEEHKNYCLLTLHRQENVDNAKRFSDIIEGVNLVAKKLNLVCLYPIHPRAEKMMFQYGIDHGEIVLMPPRDYFSFLYFEKNAQLILTDSGGVQEEACIMNVPCVTLRDNTERPETVKIGANRIAGTEPHKILECAAEALNSPLKWTNPFGDGKSGQRIVNILKEKFMEAKL